MEWVVYSSSCQAEEQLPQSQRTSCSQEIKNKSEDGLRLSSLLDGCEGSSHLGLLGLSLIQAISPTATDSGQDTRAQHPAAEVMHPALLSFPSSEPDLYPPSPH